MKNKRYTELFTYVHFSKNNTETQIKEFISEELKYNSEAQVTEDESGNFRLLKYSIESDNIDWFYSDDKGNKVEKENSITEDGMYRVYFSRIIISDYQGYEYYLEDWTMQNDYFLEDNICEHNNTITNNCSDCDDNELYDLLLKPVLNAIIDDYIGGSNNNLTDLIYCVHEGEADLTDEIVEKMEQDILKRLTL
jgi:hypothetical protein